MTVTQAIIPYAASLALDVQTAADTSIINLTGNCTFSLSNLAAGYRGSVYFSAGAANRSVTLPSAWRFEQYQGKTVPSMLYSTRWMRLDYECFGPLASDVHAVLFLT